MPVPSLREHRWPFIKAALEIGLSQELAAEVAGCKVGTVTKDVKEMGGMKKCFPDLSKRPQDVYQKVFARYVRGKRVEEDLMVWRELMPVLRRELKIEDIEKFAQGVDFGHEALMRPAIESSPELSLLEDLTQSRIRFGSVPLPTKHETRSLPVLFQYYERCLKMQEWPTDLMFAKAGVVEVLRTRARRGHLRLYSSGKKEVRLLLRALPEREQIVIINLYGIGCNQIDRQDLAKKMKVSRERIRQIEAKAMRRLRHAPRQSIVHEALGLQVQEILKRE